LDVLGIEGRVQKSVDAINLLEEAKRDNLRVLVRFVRFHDFALCLSGIRLRSMSAQILRRRVIEVPFWAHQFKKRYYYFLFSVDER